MSTGPSPILDIDEVSTQTEKKTEKVNDQRDQAEAAANAFQTLQVAGNINLTIDDQSRNKVIRLLPATALAGNFTVYLLAKPRDIKFWNDTDFDATIRVDGDVGLAVVLPPHSGITSIITDGTDAWRGGDLTADVWGYIQNTPAPLVSAWLFMATRTTIFLDNFANSHAVAEKGPNGGAVVFSIEINAVSVGELSFPDTTGSAATGSFATGGAGVETIQPGQKLDLVSPANLQAIGTIGFTFFGIQG